MNVKFKYFDLCLKNGKRFTSCKRKLSCRLSEKRVRMCCMPVNEYYRILVTSMLYLTNSGVVSRCNIVASK
jgi:hypothetical protein